MSEHCSYVEQQVANNPIETAKELAVLVLHWGRLEHPMVACQWCARSEAAERLVSPGLLQWAKVSVERGLAAVAALALEKAAQDLATVNGSPSFLECPD